MKRTRKAVWRISIVTAVAAVALTASASSEVIKPNFDTINIRMSTETKSVSGTTLDNPCTAARESIVFDGAMQLKTEVWRSTTDARYRVLMTENTSIQGRDSLGQVTYASGSSTSDVVYGPGPVTLLKYKKMNTPDAFHAVFVMDFDPVTATFNVTLQADCGDGTP